MEDLNGLRVFLQVAESRSFTAAAQRLGLTASGVSKAIGRLEKEYGQRLLHRTTRRVGLTSDGHGFYERCRQLLGDLEEAENQLTQSTASPRGHLRVHMPTAFGKKVVLPRLAQILDTLPDLRIDVELGERPIDLAEEGLDAAVRFGALPDSGLIARRLCEVRFVACAAPDYLARHGQPQRPEELVNHACLGYSTPWRSHYREWAFGGADGRQLALPISGKLNVNSAEALLDVAMAGSGIAMLADFVVWEAVQSGKLQVVLHGFTGAPTPVSLVYPPGQQHAARLRWFLNTLGDLIPSPPPWEFVTRG
jgi:LysR family transcriptional regulator, regulator for bpeEF and oprC